MQLQLIFLSNQVNDGNFGRGKQSYRGAPGPRTAADIEQFVFLKLKVAVIFFKKKPGNETERKYLPVMGVPRKL
jgi:hypothetical protein